jgi:cytochrome c biogenesis protein CcdA/thiol-disulfide isomerase/thioredoxin
MLLLLLAYFSGILTVLAPCVLPLLPIILGSSLQGKQKLLIPFIVIGSLSLSVFIFSILLKTTTLFLDVPSNFWKYLSGWILVFLGIITLFPYLWKFLTTKIGFSQKSSDIFTQNSQKSESVTKYIFLGAALGPVFSSCSPTYALILSIILPVSYLYGVLALMVYILGLASILGLIAILGQRFSGKLKFFANPKGYFQKILGIIFLCIGLAIITGYDKKIEAYLLDAWFLNTTNFEQNILNALDTSDFEEQDETVVFPTLSDTSLECQSGSVCEKKETLPSKDMPLGTRAPDLVGLENWINSTEISSLSELQGKVVMIDFWTLGCINCINTLSHTQKMHETYQSQWLVILWLHAPEFTYEQKLENLQAAVDKYGLTFPIAQDNDFATWRAYGNKYWPAFYLIDKKWNIRFTFFGEGKYEEKEAAIQKLLAE